MIESKGHKITPIDGDLAVSRNAEIGGDADIHGKARVAGSLKVEGFLDAPHIKGAAKGLFNSVEELTREYPNPRPGWFAIVLDATNKEKGILYKAENRSWVATTDEAKPYEFIKDSINVFASKGELADETQRAQGAENILTQRIVNETVRATEAENEIKKNAVKFNRIGITGYADKLELMAATIDGDAEHYIDIPAATETKAGVVSAEDKKKFVKSFTWNNDNNPSNMNDFVVAGVYDIKGEHKRVDDNLPILNTGGGHSFNARLTVLDSSISGSGEDDDKCITQVLSFSNRLGQGEVYIRTGKGSSLDNLSWEKWSTLQRNVNVGEVGSLDDLKDNGIYSGVWKQGRINPISLAFVCIVINDYFIGAAPRRISQFVYGLNKSDGSVVYQSRVCDESKGMWSDWEILNQKEIASMIKSSVDNAIKGIIADAPEAFDTLKEIADWIKNHGDVADILATIKSLGDELGQEADARMYADNDTRSKGVLFGGFSNRQTTADEVVIGYKNIDQKSEGAFNIPAATTSTAGVMSAEDKVALDTATSRALRALFIAAGAEYNDSGANKTKTTPWGETVTHKAGHYYLNGLGDITEEQMIIIYNAGVANGTSMSSHYEAYTKLRTCLQRNPYYGYPRPLGGYSPIDMNQSFQLCTQIEIINVTGTTIYVKSAIGAFQRCEKLVRIYDMLSLGSVSKSNLSGIFASCPSLEFVRIKATKVDISFSDSPNLNKESVVFLIQNATPTSAITITLHPDAYARLAEDADIVAALSAQPLITLVSA